MDSPDQNRFLGIVINPIYVVEEGLNQVFDNMESAGANAIALWPHLIEEAENGSRMPDLHIDGHKRLLARPLWGKRELHVSSYQTYEPNTHLYAGSIYQPTAPVPARLDREIPQKMIDEARRRGMQAHLGIGPFLPPGVRPQDRPVLVDGKAVQPPFIARNACLNSPAAQTYALASIEDMLCHYPTVNGLILDWVEFGAYKLEDHFTCFCTFCESAARILGYDWDQIVGDVGALWNWLHDLSANELRKSLQMKANPSAFLELLTHYPGWLLFLQFKAQSVVAFYERARLLLDRLSLPEVSLTARGWCPPWNRSSGSDYRALAGVCTAVSPKLFTFDHAVLPRWVGETLQSWNPGLPEKEILDTITSWMNLDDEFEERSFDLYQIPGPEERHPARLETYRSRLQEVASQVAGRAAYYPLSHPYLPEDQWREMVALIRESAADGMWVNMYGYLSDAKLDILRQTWK